MPIIRSPSNCRCSLWFPYECGGGRVLSRGRLRKLPPPHSYGNQRLQQQFDGLLMMGIVMPETCWAVSVRQSNKILRMIVASSWVFHLSDWRCMEPQTLKSLVFVCHEHDLCRYTAYPAQLLRPCIIFCNMLAFHYEDLKLQPAPSWRPSSSTTYGHTMACWQGPI